jgi:hypothetical protein
LARQFVADGTSRSPGVQSGRLHYGTVNSGGFLSAGTLAAILRLFDIRPGSVRIGDKTPKGYMRGWFEDAFARYPRSAATSPTT